MAQRGMQTFEVTLAAGVPQSFNVEGDFFHILSAVDPLGVRFDEGKRSILEKGVGLRVYYARVALESDTSQSVVVLMGFGHVTDARAAVSATITAPIEPAALNVPIADVTVAAGNQELLEAAVATRLELCVGVASDQANGVRIGDNTAAAGLGTLVEPGQTLVWSSRAAVYAYNAGAVAVEVNLTSLRSA